MKRDLHIGFSLIELLLGLFLMSLISTMLIQAYILHKRQYLVVQDQLERHLDAQWLRLMLSDSVRRAGFTPCLGIEQLDVRDRRIPPQFIAGEAIQTAQDVLRVNRMSEHFTELMSISSLQKILVPQELQVRKQRPVLIANCEHAEIHQVVQTEKTEQGLLLTLDSPIFFNYSELTYVGPWLEEYWFIKRSKDGKRALYYKLYRSEELSPFIHSLTIKKRMSSGRKHVAVSLGFDNQHTEHLNVVVRS